ncbi:hypothetical protein [Macrococcus equi]|uniref:hypothetical protein n=1 Tax=Macrococcus equi TaxID=3395462 RepID=UPI0039BE133B
MICLNPGKNTFFLSVVTIISITVLSLLLLLSYIFFTMKHSPLWLTFFGILLLVFMLFLNTFFVSGPINLILSTINKEKLYASNQGIHFRAGNYHKTLPAKEVGCIVVQNDVMTVYNKNGDIFAQVSCNHYQHVLTSVKQFGYRYYTSDPYEYKPVEQANISHALKSEAFFRYFAYLYRAYMQNVDPKASNRYLLQNGVLFKQGKEGPMVRWAHHLLFDTVDHYDEYRRGRFSIAHPLFLMIALITIILMEIVYFLIWGQVDKPHINQTVTALGYVIYPVLVILSVVLSYRIFYPKKTFEITEDHILIKYKKKLKYIKRQDIQSIQINNKKLTFILKSETPISIFMPQEYGIIYDLEKYHYPFVAQSTIPDKIKWYPGIKDISAEANGYAKAYLHIVTDDEVSGYNAEFIKQSKQRLKDYGITPVTEEIIHEALYID